MKSPFAFSYEIVEEFSFSSDGYKLMLVRIESGKGRAANVRFVMIRFALDEMTPEVLPATIFAGEEQECRRVISTLCELRLPIQRELGHLLVREFLHPGFLINRVVHVSVTLHKQNPGMGYDQIAAEWNEKKGI